MKKNKKAFNVIFDPAQHDKLKQLSTEMNVSRAAVLRVALNALYAHKMLLVPTCADGHGCFVPHMHARPTTAQPHPPL